MHESKPNQQEVKIITKEEFERLGKEWTELDTEYDDLFQAFLDNPAVQKTRRTCTL